MVPGLILAAGRSERMGRSKALLPCGPGGEPFVRVLARALRDGGVVDTIVVGRPDAADLRTEIGSMGLPVRFVGNPQADAGQLSSLLAGLTAADGPGVRAILMTPVDVPLVTAATVARLLAELDATGAPIVRAVHRGRHGHPVIFSRVTFDDLRHADPAVGARAVLRAHASAIRNVEVDDPGVLADIDTPEEYARIFGGRF